MNSDVDVMSTEVNVEYDAETDTSFINLTSDKEVGVNTQVVRGNVYLHLHKQTGRIVGMEITRASKSLPGRMWDLRCNSNTAT